MGGSVAGEGDFADVGGGESGAGDEDVNAAFEEFGAEGFRGLPARSGYSASKFAMHGFLESLRTELLESGVHVLVACPGFTASNIRKVALTSDGSAQGDTPLKEQKLMTAEEVADRIFKSVAKRKRTLVLTSQGRMTVFLNKLFPKFMDRMVFNHFRKEPDSPLK